MLISDADLRELIHEAWPRVDAYLRRRLPDHEVDGLVNAVFATAWRRRSDVPDPPGTLPWLIGVARNELMTHQRSTARRFRLVRRLEHEATPASQGEGGDPRTERVLTAMATLSVKDQELLRLVAWEELSNEEIAVVLDTSVGNVGVRLHRARQRLKAAMVTDIASAPSAESQESEESEEISDQMKSPLDSRQEGLREGNQARKDQR